MSLVAGIDAGTQSVKVVVYDAAERAIMASASAPLALMSGEDGSREQHPADWVATMRARMPGSMRSKHACIAATQSAGCCSRLPSSPLISANGALALATIIRSAAS